MNKHPRKSLGFFPTPISELKRLTEYLDGPQIYIKRDDLTGLATGGNKTRKLEFLLGEAIANNCNAVITGGAEQSNHCRQTAAASAMCGLECHLVLGGEEPNEVKGNLLLDKLFNAHIHWSGEFRKGEKMPEIKEQLIALGKKPYIIPYGGSNQIGALGFVEAVKELKEQLSAFNMGISNIVFASSSGGTHAGLLVGKHLYEQPFGLIGIEIDKDEAGDLPFNKHIEALVKKTAAHIETEITLDNEEIVLRNEYLGDGYGVVGDLERSAIKLAAKYEGILLDPVYTARAFGGMIDLIEKKYFTKNDSVLFWHTGGTTSLFSYGEECL